MAARRISLFFMGFKIIEFNFVWAVLQGSPETIPYVRFHPIANSPGRILPLSLTTLPLNLYFRLQQDRLLSDLTRSQQFMGSGVSSPGSFMPDPRIFQYRPPGPPK